MNDGPFDARTETLGQIRTRTDGGYGTATTKRFCPKLDSAEKARDQWRELADRRERLLDAEQVRADEHHATVLQLQRKLEKAEAANLGLAVRRDEYDRTVELLVDAQEKIDQLTQERDSLLDTITSRAPEQIRRQLWRGECGHHWIKAESENCPLCRLDYFRQRSITRLAAGWRCRICDGMWADSRGEELHEQWCPNYPAKHYEVDLGKDAEGRPIGSGRVVEKQGACIHGKPSDELCLECDCPNAT